MRRLALAGLLLAVPALAAELPADVSAFAARRDRCDQLRGEEPTDPARARSLARMLEAACRGTDAELARLKRRHAREPAAMAKLGEYDPAVE